MNHSEKSGPSKSEEISEEVLQYLLTENQHTQIQLIFGGKTTGLVQQYFQLINSSLQENMKSSSMVLKIVVMEVSMLDSREERMIISHLLKKTLKKLLIQLRKLNQDLKMIFQLI